MLCPCCSSLEFEQCCKPLIDGTAQAKTPQALMRSRYTAYTQKAIDYIFTTYATAARIKQNKAGIAAWADSATFVALEVIHPNENQPEVDESAQQPEQFVEFKAHYMEEGQLHLLHEKSRFMREQGQWRYIDGELYPHKSHSIGRNDPCPCQSGKKYKKCHGR